MSEQHKRLYSTRHGSRVLLRNLYMRARLRTPATVATLRRLSPSPAPAPIDRSISPPSRSGGRRVTSGVNSLNDPLVACNERPSIVVHTPNQSFNVVTAT